MKKDWVDRVLVDAEFAEWQRRTSRPAIDILPEVLSKYMFDAMVVTVDDGDRQVDYLSINLEALTGRQLDELQMVLLGSG